MSRIAELEVTLIAATRAENFPVQEFYDTMSEEDWTLFSTVDEQWEDNSGLLVAEFAGRGCYEAWNRSNEDTATNAGYLANIIRQQHFSVIEHIDVAFHLAGISRSLLAEITRHRHFSFSVLSQRYVPADKMRIVIPPAVRGNEVIEEFLLNGFENAVRDYSTIRAELEKQKLKKKQILEASRAVLPNMTETKMVIKGNLRSWIEFIVKRDNTAADAEIQELAREISNQLADRYPAIFGDEARKLWDNSFAQREARA